MQDLIHMITNVNNRYDGDLKYYFQLVMKAPNAYAPYHNVRHMLHVFWEAYDGGVQMGLNTRDFRNLLIAALMHDYGHQGKKGDDQFNIDIAIRAIDTYALEIDRPYLLDIRNAIRATKFPYSNEEFTQNQLILRDADQSQTFSSVWVQSILYGLGQELEMSFEQMLKMQRPFLEKLQFSTLWGKNKFEPLIQPRLELIDKMISLIQ